MVVVETLQGLIITFVTDDARRDEIPTHGTGSHITDGFRHDCLPLCPK